MFMSDLETVGSEIGRDYARLTKDEFLSRYGHLRPGTYDILSPRYDEAPDVYFDWSTRREQPSAASRFALSVSQLRSLERLLKELGIPMMPISHSDLMPIRTERSDAGLSQCEIVIDIRQEFG
jgi:hypothetical protein